MDKRKFRFISDLNYGLYDHLRRKKINQPDYLASLLGKQNYWLMLEPDNAFAKQSYSELSQLYRQSVLN